MTMLAFRTRASIYPEGTAPVADRPARRERLAIVSTRSKLCGIAAYTAAVQRQLGEAFDVTVFDLNQYLLRKTHKRVRRLADRHIKEICGALRHFDAVNIQLEHGTLGRDTADSDRRLGWLVAAAPRVSVTFHTMQQPPSFDTWGFAKSVARLKWRTAYDMHRDFVRQSRRSYGTMRHLRRAQRTKQVAAIVHNRRDLYDAKYLFGVRNVFDHPLAFLGKAEVDAVHATASRQSFPMLDALPEDAVLIGVFGFLNQYKGFGTAIQALHYLPENYHLLIFGGIHPNEIAEHRQIHPYISSLFSDAYIDTTLYDRISAPAQESAPALVLTAERGLGELLGTHPRDLSARIHFMGALGDAEFLSGMAICESVVFPYLADNPRRVRSRRRWSWAAGSSRRAPAPFWILPSITGTRSSFSISAITLSWPSASSRARNSRRRVRSRSSMPRPTRRFTCSPTAGCRGAPVLPPGLRLQMS